METPVLSKKQLKSTLSAKKNRPKETIKNVLAMPYKNNIWTNLLPEVQTEILEVFKTHIPLVKRKKVKTPWSILKTIPKAERKAYRLKNAQKINSDQPQPSKDQRLGISVGINAVTKMLERNAVRAMLVSANDEHRLLVQHILDIAVLYKVPVLRINGLSKTVKSITGICTVCLSFNKDLHIHSKCNLIVDKIESIFKTLPPPESHINYMRSIDDSLQIQVNPKDEEEKNDGEKVDEIKIREQVYLKRTNNNCRAFIPQIEKKEIKEVETKKEKASMKIHESVFLPFTEESEVKQGKTSMEVDESELIAFTEKLNAELKAVKSKVNPKTKRGYKSLIVKRLKGDKNRNQKKIQNLKQK